MIKCTNPCGHEFQPGGWICYHCGANRSDIEIERRDLCSPTRLKIYDPEHATVVILDDCNDACLTPFSLVPQTLIPEISVRTENPRIDLKFNADFDAVVVPRWKAPELPTPDLWTKKESIVYDWRLLPPIYPVVSEVIRDSIKPERLEFTELLLVDCVEHSGDDEDIARIARHDRQGPTDRLLNKLMKDRHGSPFEFGYIVFKMQVPLFVVQQMLRHRIGVSYSQWSLRWDEAQPVFYLPRPQRLFKPTDGKQVNVRKNKYAKHTTQEYDEMCRVMQASCIESYANYKALLKSGVTQELARIVLPAAQMSIIHVSFNPRSLMHFLSLRIDHPNNRYESHPQWEIQHVAEVLEGALHTYWPATYAAFCDNGRVGP